MLRATITGQTLTTSNSVNLAIFAVEQSHVQYILESSQNGVAYRAERRYSDFENLHLALAPAWLNAAGVSILPEAFPVAKLLFHTTYELDERMKALNLYLRGLVASVEDGEAPPPGLLEFLGVSEGQSAPGAGQPAPTARSRVATVANPGPFKLERYFGIHEFTAQVLLSSSDVESLSMAQVLQIARDANDDASLAQWESLSLGYTESQGHPELLTEIASTYSDAITKEHVLEVAPEEGIFIAMSSLLAPGDEVIVAWPAYQSLYEVAKARGANLRKWCCSGGLHERQVFDVSDLEALIAEAGGEVKLLVINFPHNPTGAWLSADELARVVAAARAAGAYIFSDEMYRGLEHGEVPPLPSACELYEKAVCLSGMSKVYALPGLRMGWLVCRDPAFLAQAISLKDYTTICGSAPSQVLALIAMRHRKTIVARSKAIVAEGLAAVAAFCAAHADKFSFHTPHAGPVAYLALRGDGLGAADAQAYSERLVEKTGVMVISGAMFEADGPFLRLGFAKAGFAERLAAWAATFETVPLPGSPAPSAPSAPSVQ